MLYTVEKECLAIKLAVHAFRVYLIGRAFEVQTDHQSLEWLHRLKENNARLTSPREATPSHTERDNCLCVSCAALHEIVQSNQIADRGNVTYARLRFASRTMYNHVYTCMDAGPREKQVHGSCRFSRCRSISRMLLRLWVLLR